MFDERCKETELTRQALYDLVWSTPHDQACQRVRNFRRCLGQNLQKVERPLPLARVLETQRDRKNSQTIAAPAKH